MLRVGGARAKTVQHKPVSAKAIFVSMKASTKPQSSPTLDQSDLTLTQRVQIPSYQEIEA